MDIKPTLLLAATLFLISAPEPDSRTVAEMTRNFIVPKDERALLAAERTGDRVIEASTPGEEASTDHSETGVQPEKED